MSNTIFHNKFARSTTESIGDRDKGFSLIESAIALVTLAICLAYAMPMFLYAKINNSKSEIRTGALIVAQRVFDNIRSQSITSLPKNDGANVITPTNAQIAYPTTIPASDKLVTYAMGRQYQTIVTYCEGVTTDTTVCNDQYRKFKVEVKYNDTKVYDLEGTYTSFN
jgi:prepilin-type N-terminal cleavage/methylation domain-containing protein